MHVEERAVCSSIQGRQNMRLGHALLSVFVGKYRGSGSVKMCVVIGMVEVPVGVDDVLHRSVAKAIESLFEPRGQAGATKVSTTNLPSGPLSTTTLPPGRRAS